MSAKATPIPPPAPEPPELITEADLVRIILTARIARVSAELHSLKLYGRMPRELSRHEAEPFIRYLSAQGRLRKPRT